MLLYLVLDSRPTPRRWHSQAKRMQWFAPAADIARVVLRRQPEPLSFGQLLLLCAPFRESASFADRPPSYSLAPSWSEF